MSIQEDEQKIIIVDNIDEIAPGVFKREFNGTEYTDFDEWAAAKGAVNVTESLWKCQVYMLVWTLFSCVISYPAKHITAFKVAKFKKEQNILVTSQKEPKPCGAFGDCMQLFWLIGMFMTVF